MWFIIILSVGASGAAPKQHSQSYETRAACNKAVMAVMQKYKPENNSMVSFRCEKKV